MKTPISASFRFKFDDELMTKHRFYFLLLLSICPYILGLFLPLMEHDSAQDAVMAMQMAKNNSYLELIKIGQPYLDKPHLLFWLSAWSYEIFGVYEWSYRLPSVLVLFLGAFSTYKLGEILSDKQIGQISALIFLTSQSIILSAHDVRTDAVLTGMSITALWLLVDFFKTKKTSSVILGGLFLGLAFDTKGLIAPVVVCICLLAYLTYNRQLIAVFSPKLLLGILGFALAVSPVLYAYHYQFDSHPELVVNGQQQVSGVKFILWDQVFNRLNATGFEETGQDYFFFFHTLLWVFLPYALLYYTGVFQRLVWFFKHKFSYKPNTEFLTFGGPLLVLLLISFSKFKLPHYLNILIPILGIFSASFLVKYISKQTLNILLVIQKSIAVLSVLLIGYLCYYAFQTESIGIYIFSGIGLGGLIWFVFFKSFNHKIQAFISISVVLMFWVNLNLNGIFYKVLADYQGGKQMAKYVLDENLNPDKIAKLSTTSSWSFDFYTRSIGEFLSIEDLKNQQLVLVYGKDLELLDQQNIIYKITKTVNHYRITVLKAKFIHPNTRGETLKALHLVKIL